MKCAVRWLMGCFGSGMICVLLVGCGGQAKDQTPQTEDHSSVPTAPALVDPVADAFADLKTRLLAKNPQLSVDAVLMEPRDGQIAILELRDAGVTDLSPLTGMPLEVLGLAGNAISDLTPLRGMPLRELDLERTTVANLLPLAGMPLQSLWLNETPVEDLTPLTGAPLTQLSLLGTKVRDLSPLQGAPLESLWLNDTAVTDLSPLAQSPLVSLTLHHTPVSDISVARNWPTLQRLHLGESQVSDLRPLEGLRLTRLIITPANIQQGMDVVRNMNTLRELDIEFREPRPWPPEEFWQKYDAGELTSAAQ
ncbi:hypothetical protein GC163_02845 [bacterium]|nr:hypothetical protein [bacterium]